jgi:hypothetical protein
MNKYMRKEMWDKQMFGGNKQKALKRDNFKCQECGMTQEEHIKLFIFQLIVHHIDGAGRRSEKPNNKIDNLITLCVRCHARVHREREMKSKWGDLIKQDDSIWKYPKIRYLVEDEINKGLSVKDAKIKVSKETGMGFSLVDHRYYDKKDAVFEVNSE